MAIKTFKRKEPVVFNWEDESGHVYEFSLAGEMPIEAVMKLAELEERGKETQVTKEDLVEIYSAVLGEDSAHKLIFELRVGQDTLEEVLTWYAEELAARKKGQNPNPKVAAKKAR